jgi:hypothetical protein
MKNLFLSLSIVAYLLIGCHESSPKKEQASLPYDSVITVKSIHDTVALLKLCFSPLRITKNVAIWKPSLDDWFNMPLSMDNLCHSKLDTIVKFSADTSLVLFRTDSYDENNTKATAHVCSPTYSIVTVEKHGDHYVILNFKKNLINVGSFGNGYDTLTVENFGVYDKLVCFSSSHGGTGSVSETKTYFDMNYEKVFDFNNYVSANDSSERDEDYYELKQHLVHIPGSDGRDDIMLKGTVISFDPHSKSYKKRPVTEYYRQNNWGIYKRTLN